MESGSTVTGSGTCKEEVLKRQKANEVEDKISNLPESLISHILSLLPIKDAVRTCVLCKGWIHRWISITKLDLNDIMFCSPWEKKTSGKRHFVNFVNRILLLSKGSSRESVSLVMSIEGYDVSLVNLWISSILNQGVKSLSIGSRFKLPFSPLTSHSLFNSSSLEELVLTPRSCSIRVPTSFVFLGNLKLLTLSGILFTVDSFNNLELSLPVLKKFEMRNCTWLSANGVTLKAPILESVSVTLDYMCRHRESHNYAIKFSASHLTEFTISADKTPQIILLDPSSVHNASAHITLYENRNNPDAESRAFQLLKQFSEVKYLNFKGENVLAKSNVADLPLFGMLSHLELCYVAGGEVLLGLLLNSPILETLVLQGISKFDEELLNSATVPHCLTSTLQVVEFGGVQGLEHELCLAKFIMKNGILLKRMSFSICCYVKKSKAFEEFKEKLLSFKKSFSFAIVEFSQLGYRSQVGTGLQ